MAGNRDQTYISSLLTENDVFSSGIQAAADGSMPIFFGDVVIHRAIVFPDGTTQTSAPANQKGNIDSGTF